MNLQTIQHLRSVRTRELENVQKKIDALEAERAKIIQEIVDLVEAERRRTPPMLIGYIPFANDGAM